MKKGISEKDSLTRNSRIMQYVRHVKEKSKITSLRSKDMFDITEPLQKIHMDFYGPVNVMSTSSINSLK